MFFHFFNKQQKQKFLCCVIKIKLPVVLSNALMLCNQTETNSNVIYNILCYHEATTNSLLLDDEM